MSSESLSKDAAERNSKARNYSNVAAEKNMSSESLSKDAAERNSKAGNNSNVAAEKNKRTGNLSKDAAERNSKAGNNSNVAAEKNMKTGNLSKDAAERNSKAGTTELSTSYNNEDDTTELSTNPTKKGMSLDMYFKVHGIDLEDGEDDEDEEYDHVEVSENEEGNGEGNAENEGTKKKKLRGKTTCSNIHSAHFIDRREVEFFQGQPIGPTTQVVSDLSHFLGTVVRNPTFVTLLYTSWHGVPSKNKEDMWVYVNKKFILPPSAKDWVMDKLCDAWKKYKGEVKKFHFKKYRTKKKMLQNRPLEIPEIQFRKLIRYWSLSEIKAMSDKNTENRSKQTCPHRMGTTNFGIVRKQLRESKENHAEPTRAEMFTATRTSKKGKEVDTKTQAIINELQHRIEAGENDEDAFISVLGRDQPGRLRCYGGGITKTSLKRDEAVRQVKVEYDKKFLSLQNEMQSVHSILKMVLQQMNPGMTDEDVAALVQAQRNSSLDASSRPENTPDPRSSESTHIPQQE